MDYISSSSSSDDTEDIDIDIDIDKKLLHNSNSELNQNSVVLQLNERNPVLQKSNPVLQKQSAELQEHNPLLQKHCAESHKHNTELQKQCAELHERSAVLQRNINKLKLQKEKINESKQVYESDLKLFNIFKNSVETNENFEIPVIFAKKYEIMNKLFIEDKLSWENFINNYKNENYYGDYFSSNSYEEKFANNSKNDLCTTTIDEQIDISIK